jgi:hypothetical protein
VQTCPAGAAIVAIDAERMGSGRALNRSSSSNSKEWFFCGPLDKNRPVRRPAARRCLPQGTATLIG